MEYPRAFARRRLISSLKSGKVLPYTKDRTGYYLSKGDVERFATHAIQAIFAESFLVETLKSVDIEAIIAKQLLKTRNKESYQERAAAIARGIENALEKD